MMPQQLESLPPSNDKISHQLDVMLARPDFNATPQQVALLKYVVNQSLAGNADRIKGYTVATEVFGRNSDFDQNIDPIVSIQAARLRRALARYYQKAGKDDAIRIDIPKGSYVPVFEVHTHARATLTAMDRSNTDASIKGRWPSVLVRPVHNFANDPELNRWEIAMAIDLADELSRYPDIQVQAPGPENATTAADKTSARFVIDGSIRGDKTCVKVIHKLTDTRTNRQIWSDSCRTSAETARTIDFQEQIAREVAVKVAGKHGWIANVLDRESQGGSPQYSQAYEAILRYDDYRSTSTAESFQQALTAVDKAITSEPDCGRTWTMRARIFAEIYALGIPGFDRPLEQALAFALKGRRLSPNDQQSHVVMAFIHLLRNDLEMGRTEAEQALRLGPETLFALDGIGYVMTLMGDWERGPALIEKVIRLNPFYSNYVHYALWLNWIRQEDYDRACQETMKLNRPANFWDHLTKAATFGLLGHIEKGCQSAAELLALRPDFPQRGCKLLGHFIKFEAIVEQVVEGLDAVGIEVQ